MKYYDQNGGEIPFDQGSSTASSNYYGVNRPYEDAYYFCSAINPTYPQWSAYQFPNPLVVASYQIQAVNDDPVWVPTDWTFEGSNDGQTWDILDTQSGVTWTTLEWKEFQIDGKFSSINDPL